MRFTNSFKKIISSLSTDAGKSVKEKEVINYTWEGVYLNADELPKDIKGFDSKKFVRDTYSMTKALVEQSLINQNTIQLEVKDEVSLLPFLISSVFGRQKNKLRILDFGGGMGVTYLHLKSSINSTINLDYHVVEQKEMCEEGKNIFISDSSIHFHSELPADLKDINIIYINSALQYLMDYHSLLKKLASYKPEYILLVRLSAGDVPTFISIQKNVSDTRIPYYFFNLKELQAILLENGYDLIFKGAIGRKYNMDNLPPANRLEYQSNLLFIRK